MIIFSKVKDIVLDALSKYNSEIINYITVKLGKKADEGHTHNYAPISHASSNDIYGLATESEYGHVMISDTCESNTENDSITAASRRALLDVRTEIMGETGYVDFKEGYYGSYNGSALTVIQPETIVETLNNYDNILGSMITLGVKNPNALTISLNGTSQDSYDGSSAKTINITPSSIGAAPTSHASTTTSYGIGDSSTYGHVKLSDSYTSSGGEASSGIGASSKAVYDAYNACAKSSHSHNNYVPFSGGTMTGTLTFGTSTVSEILTDGTFRVGGTIELWTGTPTAGSTTYSIGKGTSYLNYLTLSNDLNCRTVYASNDGTGGNAGYVIGDNLRTNSTSTTSNAYCGFTSSGILRKYSSSSKRFKHDIEPLTDKDLNPNKLYDTEIFQFIYNKEHLSEDDERQNMLLPGFIVEELEKQYPCAVSHDKDGRAESWQPHLLIPPMLKLIQDQKREIDNLKERVTILESKDSNLDSK